MAKARTKAKPLNAARVREMVEAADKAMAREKISPRDSTKDRLFALIMARMDRLQANRAAYMDMFAELRRTPPLLAHYVRLVGGSMKNALVQSEVALDEPRLSLQTAGLLAVYIATVRAWEKDTSADLSATMRALDQNLGRAEMAARWLGFEAA